MQALLLKEMEGDLLIGLVYVTRGTQLWLMKSKELPSAHLSHNIWRLGRCML